MADKRKMQLIDSGQELTIDVVREWLDSDLDKLAGLVYMCRTVPVIRDVIAQYMLEQAQKAAGEDSGE